MVVTVAVVIWVAGFLKQFVGIDAPLGRLLRMVGFRFSSDTTIAYIIGWGLVLAVIGVVGVFVEAGSRGFFQRAFDAVLSRVPLVGGIYGTSKQLVAMLDTKDNAHLTGMQAVFCHFGNERGCAVLALLVSPQTFRIGGSDYLIVVVPTALVPIGGGLLFVPAEAVQTVDLSVISGSPFFIPSGRSRPSTDPQDS